MHKTDKYKHTARRTDTDIERDRLTKQTESGRALERESERARAREKGEREERRPVG